MVGEPQPIKEYLVQATIRSLPEALQDVRKNLDFALDLDMQQSASAVRKLVEFGREVGATLFPSGFKEFLEANERSANEALVVGAPPYRVEVTSPEDFVFPFELMKWQDSSDSGNPLVTIRTLLGMSALVSRRVAPPSVGGNPSRIPMAEGGGGVHVLDTTHRLAMTLIRNEHLDHEHPNQVVVSTEVSYLCDAVSEAVSVFGPWPRAEDSSGTVLSKHLVNPSLPIAGQYPRAPISILHLSGHTNTSSDGELRYYFSPGLGANISLGGLWADAAEGDDTLVTMPRPVVFMNSCHSAAPPEINHTSFGTFFLDHGYRGFIGTIHAIPLSVAEVFARVFYEHLLKGRVVGDAIHEARWHLMEAHSNPLGVFYAYYGDAEVRVSNSRLGDIVPGCGCPGPLVITG